MTRRPVGLENLFGPPKQKSKKEEREMRRAANRSWHRPPQISPNYGARKRNIMPKSSVAKVLLHDNHSQQHLLDAKLHHLDFQREKTEFLLKNHRRSFLIQQSLKQKQLRENGVMHVGFLPNAVANGYCQVYGHDLGLNMDTNDRDVDQEETKKKFEHKRKLENGRVQYKVEIAAQQLQPSGLYTGTRASGHAPFTVSASELLSSSAKRQSTSLLPQLTNVGVDSVGNSQVPQSNFGVDNVENSRISQSAFPSETRPSSRAFLTHDFSLLRGHTFTAPQYKQLPTNNLKYPYSAPAADPRFVQLHSSLIPNDTDLGGFISLSPSGAFVLQKHAQPNNIYSSSPC